MALKLSSIKRELSNDGEWIDIPEWVGVRVKVRSINSKDYLIAHGLLQQKLIRALGRFPTTPEWEPALGRLVARHLLRGWEGLIVGNGDVPSEYTTEQAEELLTDPTMLALEQQIIWAAGRVGERDVEFTVDAVKNSDAPSATI